MKKKIVSLCLVAALAATAVVGGTLAYFTDTDVATNVMVTGNVSIIQNEQQRVTDANHELVNFEDEKALYPITGDTNGDGKIDTGFKDDIDGATFVDQNGDTQTLNVYPGTAGGKTGMFSLANNVVDKIVSVTNDGQSEVYVRTLFAYELPTVEYAESIYGGFLPEYVSTLTVGDKEYVDVVNTPHFLITSWHQGMIEGKGDILPMENDEYVIIDNGDSAYLVSVYYYKAESKLAVGETSHPSLKQIYMSALADNNDAQILVGADGEYKLLALSQAVQTAGFTSAEEALNEAFGEITVENAAEWFAGVPNI